MPGWRTEPLLFNGSTLCATADGHNRATCAHCYHSADEALWTSPHTHARSHNRVFYTRIAQTQYIEGLCTCSRACARACMPTRFGPRRAKSATPHEMWTLVCVWDYDVECSAAVWYMSYGLYGRTRMEATARDLHDALALQ